MNLTIAPADVRAELADLNIEGQRAFLQHLLADAALPAACVPAVEGALTLLGAAQAQLEAAARIAEAL